MKTVKTFETAEIKNTHAISVRFLLTGDAAQFEHLALEPGQEQKTHQTYTNVYLYVLEGSGILEANDERIPLTADLLVEMPPETPHRLLNTGAARLRVLNIKSPRPQKATHLVMDRGA